MSLRQPALKMAKSHTDQRSKILITDSPHEIKTKVMAAMTDSLSGISYDPKKRPGLSNLIEIMSHFDSGRSSMDIAREYESLSLRDFKDKVIDCLISNLSCIRKEYERLQRAENRQYLHEVATKGSESAKASADATMTIIRDVVGYG
jgi:tryptophanyl-tRNA synthetase